MLHNADRGGVLNFPGKMRYEGVMLIVQCYSLRGVGGGPISRKKSFT